MKLNHDLQELMRKASSLLQSGPKGIAANVIQRVLQRSLPGAAPQQPSMKDINPPPPGRELPPAPEPMTPPDVPAFVADLLNRFGVRPPHTKSAPETNERGQFLSGALTNAAGTREYKLYIPTAYNGQALPLVVMLHGCTQNPDDFAAGTEMNAQAEQTPCFVLYPAQAKSANGSQCWNWFNAVDQQREQGEPSIIADITRKVMADYKVLPKQVYVAGLSAGGAMAAIMGSTYPELYAAVGIHSGLPYAAATDLMSAMQAMRSGMNEIRSAQSLPSGLRPIIVFHGDRDKTVHPRNGEQLIEQHVRRDAPSTTEKGRVPDGHAYTFTRHQKRDGSPLAEQWLIHGAGHAWSGGSSKGTYTDARGPHASV
jgi:poly(hydroxyalkanoate) depolymerase family esterase